MFFFFSSRRRHTRCLSDWSSDVCSSDLREAGMVEAIERSVNGSGGLLQVADDNVGYGFATRKFNFHLLPSCRVNRFYGESAHDSSMVITIVTRRLRNTLYSIVKIVVAPHEAVIQNCEGRHPHSSLPSRQAQSHRQGPSPDYLIFSNSTSNVSVALGGMTPPAPAAP